jgi:protein tyrosine/serine phosphatase
VDTRTRLLAVVLLLCAALQATGCARVLYNHGTVVPGEVYRSAQPSPLFLRWLIKQREIRTLVNLRGDTPGFESAFAARHGLQLHSFDLSASRPPTQADIDRFLAILADPSNHPVLVHCRNGVDRTGYMLGLYRVQVQGWTGSRATREMNRYLQFEPLNDVPHKVVRDQLRASP